MTVERPLRLSVDLSHDRLEPFLAVSLEAGDGALGNAVRAVADREGPGPHRDFGAFEAAVKRQLGGRGRRAALTAKRKRLLRDMLADRDEEAATVVKRVHPRSAVADPIRGRFPVGHGPASRVVEYEPDTKRRDTEQISLLEEGGIEGFQRSEVLPYGEDA